VLTLVGETLWLPSPAALVVIGVGGPIVVIGGVMVGVVGDVAVFGVGAAAEGTLALGTVPCAGVAVVVGGTGVGVAALVCCAASHLVQLIRINSAKSRRAMGFSLLKMTSQLGAKLSCVLPLSLKQLNVSRYPGDPVAGQGRRAADWHTLIGAQCPR
jgi:hypothetical protein